MPPVLTAQDVARYHVDGFLALPPLTDAAEVARIRAIYDDLFARRAGHEAGDHFDLFGDEYDPTSAATAVPQILGPDKYAPELRESALWRNATEVACQLLGARITLGAHAILKPAGSPKSTPWHQDEAYWGKQHDFCSFSIWIPLQDVDETNGCMHFVPRSHWGEILPHRSAEGNIHIHGLELDGIAPDPRDIVAVPLRAGGATVHHQRLLHMTTPNRSREPRRALVLVGGAPGRHRHEPKRLAWLDAIKSARAERARAFAERERAKPAAAAAPT